MSEISRERLYKRGTAAVALLVGSLILTGEFNSNDEESANNTHEPRVRTEVYSEPVTFTPDIPTTTTNPPTTSLEATTTTTTLPTTTTTQPLPQPEKYPVGCDNYYDLVAQYDWPIAGAMRTMYEESRCDPNAVSKTNDHGLFQLHGQPVYDPAENIAIAYSMYVDARRGSHNFSAWYAVCTPDLQPKYPEIHCS